MDRWNSFQEQITDMDQPGWPEMQGQQMNDMMKFKEGVTHLAIISSGPATNFGGCLTTLCQSGQMEQPSLCQEDPQKPVAEPELKWLFPHIIGTAICPSLALFDLIFGSQGQGTQKKNRAPCPEDPNSRTFTRNLGQMPAYGSIILRGNHG